LGVESFHFLATNLRCQVSDRVGCYQACHLLEEFAPEKPTLHGQPSALVVGHLVVLGLKGWLTPAKWPWGLPSISLLAATAAAIPLVIKFSRSSGKPPSGGGR
jgi:hypothetical protein